MGGRYGAGRYGVGGGQYRIDSKDIVIDSTAERMKEDS